jgi:mannosyltransferase
VSVLVLMKLKTLLLEEFIKKYKFQICVLIALVHVLFKSYHLDQEGLWFDEVWSVHIAQQNITSQLEIAQNDANPPLYPLILHYWIRLFGISEFSVRFLTVLFSAGAASVLFLLCLKFFNWQTAIFGSILFFTSNEFYYYGLEARTFSQVLFFVLLSYYLYLSLLREPNWLNCFLLAFFNAAIFYSHYIAFFSVIVQVILFPIIGSKLFRKDGSFQLKYGFDRKVIGYYFFSGLILILFLLPFKNRLIALYNQSAGSRAGFLEPPDYDVFKRCVYEFFNGKVMYQSYIFITIFIVLLLVFIKKSRQGSFNSRSFLFALFTGPLLLYGIYLLAQTVPFFLKRYVLFTFLGFLFAFAYLVSFLKLNFSVKLLLFVILSFFSFIHINYPRPVYMDYKSAVAFLKHLQKGKPTLIINDSHDLFSYYYDKKIFKLNDIDRIRAALSGKGVFIQWSADWPLKEDFSMYRDIYHTSSFERLNGVEGRLRQMMLTKYILISEINCYQGINITHFYNPAYNRK